MLVRLSGPMPDGRAAPPARGEALRLGDVAEVEGIEPRLRRAVALLAEAKAPAAVAQLTVWHLGAGLDWATLGRLSSSWASPGEMALARRFVERLASDSGPPEILSGGLLFHEVAATAPARSELASELDGLLESRGMLGLVSRPGVPDRPEGPAVACRIELSAGTAMVRVWVSDEPGASWISAGKFTLDLSPGDGSAPEAPALADRLAEGLLGRLVRAEPVREAKASGKASRRIRVVNASPLVLRGLTVSGPDSDGASSTLLGLSLPPRRSRGVPASSAAFERLGLKGGARVVSAELGGL
jgi:hypothetical protein